MNVTSKLFQIVAGAVLLAGWHLCAQDKSLPVDVSCTIESHLVSEVKSGFIEYTNEYPPKVLVYLHQTVQAEGDLSDTNYTDTFSLLNDSTWDPDAWVMASATTGTTDYSGANWWSRYIYSNADGTTTNNILTIIEWNDGWPDTTTNGPYYTVVYAWGNGGMFGWDYDYWNGGGFTDRSGAFEFIAGPYYWFLEDLYSQMLSIHDGTSETVEDVWLTAPQYHTVDYSLDTEYTTERLISTTLAKLNADTNIIHEKAEINLVPDERSLTLGKVQYSIGTPVLETNQLYVLYEQLTARTNGEVYKHFGRTIPIVGSNLIFTTSINIEISGEPAFMVNGKKLLGQKDRNDTTLELTHLKLWRMGDFDPSDGRTPCPPECPCDFKEEPGMPVWSVSEPDISLHVSDTPVTYKTSLGTPMSFAVGYDQHDPRMTNTFVPLTAGWHNSWSSYVHILGNVDTNGVVDFSKWTGYLYPGGGGVKVFGYLNDVDPNSHEVLRPLNNYSPITGGTNWGANGFRLSGSDGSADIYGLVTPVYSTRDESGHNEVDRLAITRKIPIGLAALPFIALTGTFGGIHGYTYEIPFEEEDGDYSTNSGSSSGGVIFNIGESGLTGKGKGWQSSVNSLFYTNEADALLTEHIDRYGNTTHFYYTNVVDGSGKTFYLLKYVVDCDNQTNVIAYNGNNQIASVTTPYGQQASFTYQDGGQIIYITDAQGMTSSFNYDSLTGVMKSMATPYGTTFFDVLDQGFVEQSGYVFGSAQGTNTISRAIVVTRPNGAHDLYAYRYNCSDLGVPAQYAPSPADSTPVGMMDDGGTSGTNSDASFYLRNSFHWGPKQFELLSTNPLVALDQLTPHDYMLATMSHWLRGRYAGSAAGGSISAIVQGSPDGVTAGAVTWFDYGDKVAPYQLGGVPLSRILEAQLLPDGGTHYVDTTLNAGLPVSETSTYSLPDGSIGTRTYTATYTNVTITQSFAAGTNAVSSGYWTFPELTGITGPQGESRLHLSSPDFVRTILQTNGGVVSTLQVPERLALTSSDAVTNVTLTYFNPRGQVAGRYAAGLTTTNLFDANGYPARSIAMEIQRTNAYTFTNGRLASATSPLGLVTGYSWDQLGRLTGVSYPDNTTLSNIYTRLDLTAQKDRLGHWQYATYDFGRHRLTATDRRGNTTTYTYCDCGALESIADPLGGITTYGTDLNGRVTNLTHVASGRSYAVTRNALGQITQVADSAAPYSYYAYLYNNQGLLTNVMFNYYGTPLYQAGYDIYDRPTVTVNANGIGVTNTYDPAGRLLSRSYPNGGAEQYEYRGTFLSRYYDLNHQPTTYGYDPAGRITSVTNANLEVTRYGYDAANDLLSLVDGRGNTTAWVYDAYRRATKKTDANNVVVWTNAYNANGWLASSWTPAKGLAAYVQDNNGNITNVTLPHGNLSRVYDALNRPTRVDFGNIRLTLAYTGFGAFQGALSSETAQPIVPGLDPADATRGVAYGYANELLATETRSDQTVSYLHDSFGRLLAVTNATGTFRYTYNAGGNLVQSLQYPSVITSRAYDGMGQVTNIAADIVGGLNTVAYDYDLNGNRQHVYRAKNLAAGLDSSVTYGYDPIGQLTSAVGQEADNTARLNEQFGYGYDQSGNLVARTNGVLVQAFVSDPANELTNVTRNTSLTFDGNGTTNLASVTVNGQSTAIYSDQTFATTNGLTLLNGSNSFTVVAVDTSGHGLTNRFSASLPVTQRLSYDANGNLTSDGTRGFEYDDWNQLVRVTTTNVWRTEYAYDGLRRHHAQRDYQWRNSGWQLVNTCYYVYAGWNVVQEVNTTEPTISYTHGLELLERDSTSTNQPALFYQTDGNGNVTLLFDLNQQVQARYLYDPYGNLLAKSGPLVDVNRYRFSGKEYDLHSGLYYYGYRFYEPNLQRWLNRDPIGENGGINLYGFVGNDPVNEVDPLGLIMTDEAMLNKAEHGFGLPKPKIGPTEGEWQLSVGFSGTLGVMKQFTGLPDGFISAGNYVGITSSGTLFFQHNNTEMNGFGIFGGINFSLQLAHSKCPMKAGKSISEGTHGEVGLGDWADIELSFDIDDESIGGDIPLPDNIKPQLGLGGGFIIGSGPTTVTTYAEPPGSHENTSYQNSPSYLYGF